MHPYQLHLSFLPCTPLCRARICKRLRSPGIDSKESIPPACAAWRAEPVFADLLSRPGIDFQPRQPYFSYRPVRLHRLAKSIPRNRFLGSINVYKYGLSSPDGESIEETFLRRFSFFVVVFLAPTLPPLLQLSHPLKTQSFLSSNFSCLCVE